MLTREPSFSRASTIGLDSSMRRPTAAAMRWQMLDRWAWSRNRMLARDTLPPRSTNVLSGPFTMMSVIASSSSSVSSGPSPVCRAPVRWPARAARGRSAGYAVRWRFPRSAARRPWSVARPASRRPRSAPAAPGKWRAVRRSTADGTPPGVDASVFGSGGGAATGRGASSATADRPPVAAAESSVRT